MVVVVVVLVKIVVPVKVTVVVVAAGGIFKPLNCSHSDLKNTLQQTVITSTT